MKRFWQIWRAATVASAVAALVFWATVERIQAPIVTRQVTLFPAVLTPRDSRAWMRVPLPFSQPDWIGEPLVAQ